MGGGASVPVASAEDIAGQVKGLGDPYAPYAERILADGIDGAFLNSITSADLPDLFMDIGVASAVHKKKLDLIFSTFKTKGPSLDGAAMPAEATDIGALIKKFACFLSHYKLECGTEARLVQMNMRTIIEKAPIEGSSNEVFLDSDDLSDLRNLLEYVKQTKALVLLQSKRVLERPWVIAELYTAVTNEVPIVALNVQNSYSYDYAQAMNFLMFFDQEIDIANPGAAQLLSDMGIDPVDVAYRLSDSLPNIISTDFNPNASEKVIQASLEDLVESIRKASPIAPSVSKEEWLKKRKSYKPNSVVRKAHGSSEGSAAAASAAATGAVTKAPSKGLADVPHTVPELPGAYLVRSEDLTNLKAALLEKEGSTSKKSNRVAAHGMGGVGKTTIAAALVSDTEVRSSFEKIVWVSIGQDPNLRSLQDSIHVQLTESSLPDTVKSDGEVLAALRKAAKGMSLLLVLDDIWDAAHEKALGCIDGDSDSSRLFFTTRIRGLLKNAAEVDLGVLPEGEALKLLVSSADVDIADVPEGSDDYRIALEMVSICGALPLTLAIAGGMVSDNPDGFTDEVVELMKEDGLREQEDEDEMMLEERVISSSLKMIKGKNKDLVVSIFKFFAVFPEDVPIPAGFFNVFAPTLSGEVKEKKAKMTVGNCLGQLLKYNLIKGSLASGHGVFMHDIVRDFVINQQAATELQAMHKSVVATILAARPEPDGFPMPNYAVESSFEGYVARYAVVHMKGALGEDEAPPDEWLAHKDNVIKTNAAKSYSQDGAKALFALSEAREEAGELVRAAYVSFAAALLIEPNSELYNEHVFRAQGLLERADDKDVVGFEKDVIIACSTSEFGSERYQNAMNRMKAISTEVQTCEGLMMEGMGYYGQGFVKLGWYGGGMPSDESMIEGYALCEKCCRCWIDAAELPGDPAVEPIKLFARCFESPFMYSVMGISPRTYALPYFQEEMMGFNEAAAVEAIKAWDRDTNGRAMKEKFGMDMFQCGGCQMLAYTCGNLDAYNMMTEKILSTFKNLDLASSKEHAMHGMEITFNLWSLLPSLLELGQFENIQSWMDLMGLGWNGSSFETIGGFMEMMKGMMPTVDPNIETLCFKFIVYLADRKGVIDTAEVNDWMSSPAELIEMHKNYLPLRDMNYMDIPSFAAKVYLKLGRDDDAYEIARLAVEPEEPLGKITARTRCYSVLGQVAAKRGNLDEANKHFAKAVEVIKPSNFSLLGVIAARDWKKFCLEPNGQDSSAADAAIDEGCAKMNKTREQLQSVFDADTSC